MGSCKNITAETNAPSDEDVISAPEERAEQRNPVALLADVLRRQGYKLDEPSFERARLELDRLD